jgi:hypothetical protein
LATRRAFSYSEGACDLRIIFRVGSYLKLSLVTCPVALYPASSTTQFHQINRKIGKGLRQQMIEEVAAIIPAQGCF